MSLVILSAPSASPLSISEVKSYLRIGEDVADASLDLLLKAAIEMVEAKYHRALAQRSLRQSFTRAQINKALKIGAANAEEAEIFACFYPSNIIEAREIDQFGNAHVLPVGAVKIVEGKFVFNQWLYSLEVDFTAGFTNIIEIPNFYRLKILEEIGRALNVRDNETPISENNISGARL